MDKINAMRSFCAVIREGGFSAAARKLGVSKVVVSRNVAALENDLGVRLLQRTTRKMSPTDDGVAYYDRCRTLLEDFEALERCLKDRGELPTGRLRISVPSEAFTSRHLLPFFTGFARQYPKLELDIELSDRYVDIVEEGFDAAVRIGELESSSLIARKLSDLEIVLCASAHYLSGANEIKHPLDLQEHALVMDSNYRGGQACLFSREDNRVSVKANSRIRVNSSVAVIEFIKQGFGIGLCPSFMLGDELRTGELVPLLQDWSLGSGGIYLVYSHRKHLSAKVRVLVQELSRYFQNRDSV